MRSSSLAAISVDSARSNPESIAERETEAFDNLAKTVLAIGLIALSRRGTRQDLLRWSPNAAFPGRR
jgi:hypothetical protein